ncbi:MAG TPA: DUF2235 domain-containing protein [Acidobacteriaceae bacterium]|nr:DUF2235 domain-containing protein [Acidobacteriaceae bacterium]
MPKKLILCADGTWNTPQGVQVAVNDTNVRKIFCALASDETQQAFYDSGVGTNGTPIDHLAGGAMGEGLFQKIQECYRYLADAWSPGSSIYLFGFSRGAYTVRSLGGMIARFGLPTRNLDNEAAARVFAAYRERDPEKQAAMKLQLELQYDIQGAAVRMIGVWDTVGSLGIPGLIFELFDEKKYGFLDTALHPNVQNAYHAVSIDERRRQFEPTLWTNPDGSDRVNDAQMEQVWFPGVHCDVGGGYAPSDLSDIPLAWMMRKAMPCGLTFTQKALECLPVDAHKVTAQAHDEWKLIPWGIAKHRTVPPRSFMASSVQERLDHSAAYRPPNLNLSDGQLQGYGTTDVLS